MKFGTKAVHAGVEADPATGAIMTPIYQTSTYIQEAPNVHKGYAYGRTSNPTRTALQKSLAALENAAHGVCFSSGMAAIDAVIRLLSLGDEVIAGNDIYGGSYRIFTQVLARFGIRFHFVDMGDVNNIVQHINPNTKMIWVETPSNPMLNIVDLQAVGEVAKAHQLLFCVDNTFATPYLQQPLSLGADIVVHSVTKYLGGHSDVIMGAVICNDEELHRQLLFLQKAVGAVPAPMDCFLTLRGVKTLHLRMQQHCKNAEAIAHFLRQHPQIDKVYFPGFEDHPQHQLAKKQMYFYGGMVTCSLKKDTLENGVKMMSATKIFSLAESLGGVESLIGHPATMTHASLPPEERRNIGIVDSLMRLSIGIEDTEDLIADLAQALEGF